MGRHIAVWLILSVLCWPGAAGASQTIKLGLVTTPGSAQNICAEKFKELLEGRSRYKVKIYHSASLGTETEILQQIQMGSIQMGVITLGPFDAFVPEVRVVGFPFLFDGVEQVDQVLEGAPGQELLKRLEKTGFKGLAFSENGFRHLTNNRLPVHAANDVSGLKIRVMESVFHKELWRLLGANPTPMGWPIYTELQQGTIDAQENPLWVAVQYKLFEVQKYLSLTGHVYSAHIDVANLKWFDGRSAEDRALITKCMVEAARYQKKTNRDKEAEFLAKLKEAGMEVDEQPDRDSFRVRLASFDQLEIYQEPGVKEMLQMFFEAVGR